jgi:hypothetical protein
VDGPLDESPVCPQPVPAAGPDGTWVEMDRVFRLTDHPDR